MRVGTLLYFYGRRLRTHPIQELLAGTGIAIGVALVFAVVVANQSITGSAGQIVSGIAGSAQLQVTARDDRGVGAALVDRVRGLPDVERAAGLLEQRATIEGPRGSTSAELVGVDADIASFDGPLTRSFNPAVALLLRGAVVLPEAVARAGGIPERPGATRVVTVDVRGRGARAAVAAVLGPELIGPLADSFVVVASLPYVQQLAALPDHITRVLVTARHGRVAEVRDAIARLGGGRVTVAPIDAETRLLDRASAPNRQATGVFAAVAAVVGLLLAFNAMLLTVPERRRSIAGLRLLGFTPRQVIVLLGFQAVALGIVASAVGLLIGELLSETVFESAPSYLTFAFALGAQHHVPFTTVALAFAGGVAATCVAAAQPLLDLRSGQPVDAVHRQHGEPGQALTPALRRTMGLAALVLLVVTTLLVLVPPAVVAGVAALALAVLLAMPALLGLALRTAGWVAARTRWNMLIVAVMALRATTLRAIGLAAIGAVAVFGSVTIEGTHSDLVRGLDRNFADYLSTADLWITSGGDENSLTTESFRAGDALLRRVRAVPGVAGVRPYYGGLLDVGDRRVWIIARPAADRPIVPPSQLLDGDLARASALVRRGGWAAVSDEIVRAQHTGVGGTIALPTPAGTRRYRVAATLTNLGWGPGSVVMNAADYRRAWLAPDPTALELDLRRGASASATRAAVAQALGRNGALHVQTTPERLAQFRLLARQGLERLSQISTLLLIAAALSLAAGTGAAMWQRRRSLAAYRLHGFLPWQLWRALLLEAGIVLSAGCLTGAVAGLYGHYLAGRWLRLTTGFPGPFAIAGWQAFETLGLVAGTAIAMLAVPSYLAAQVPARTALQD